MHAFDLREREREREKVNGEMSRKRDKIIILRNENFSKNKKAKKKSGIACTQALDTRQKIRNRLEKKMRTCAVFSGMNPLCETFLNVLNDCIECKDSKDPRVCIHSTVFLITLRTDEKYSVSLRLVL